MNPTRTKSVVPRPVRAELSPTRFNSAPPSTAVLSRHLRGVILLAGSPRMDPLEAAVGRSRLELPVTPDTTVLDCLRAAVADLQQTFDLPPLPLRIHLGSAGPSLTRTLDGTGPPTLIESDPVPFRGTGGLLRDAVRYEPDEAYVLVMLGCQIPLAALPTMFERLAETPGEIRLLACPAHPTAGLMLARCGALRTIAPIGYIDFKEQALPRLSDEFCVRLTRVKEPATSPVADRRSYLASLRRLHVDERGGSSGVQVISTGRTRGFQLIEHEASVHPSSLLHDTVVLRDARIGLKAALAHCLVAPGAVVAAQRSAWDCVVGKTDT